MLPNKDQNTLKTSVLENLSKAKSCNNDPAASNNSDVENTGLNKRRRPLLGVVSGSLLLALLSLPAPDPPSPART